jgi:hypothetical protein
MFSFSSSIVEEDTEAIFLYSCCMLLLLLAIELCHVLRYSLYIVGIIHKTKIERY